jgi:3-hydroxyisobutyrate dehydrogenase-like beta-hydroxyacid dehydrogenase
MTRVAVLGLGAMGRPMAGRLLDAGHDVRVWNRTPGRGAELVARGAAPTATPAEAVRGAEVAITMVADPPALEAVLFGEQGVAGAIDPSATLVDMSTVGPSAARGAAARLRPAAFVDAPVLGSVPHAEAGTLTLLVGGDPEVVEANAELLSVFGTVVRAGGVGSGAALKLAANAASFSALVGLGEVLGFTDRLGMDPEVVLDGIGMGALASLVERWRARITSPASDAHFRLALARKDLRLLLDEADPAAARLDVPGAAAARFEAAQEAGLGDADFSAIARFVRS